MTLNFNFKQFWYITLNYKTLWIHEIQSLRLNKSFWSHVSAPATSSNYIIKRQSNLLCLFTLSEIPLVERFELQDSGERHIIIAWLENKFYVTYSRSSTVQVFADRAPFEELEEPFEVPDMGDPGSSVASADTRSIFFSEDNARCIWRIQMPEKELTRMEVDGLLSNISITPNGDLLAGVRIFKVGTFNYELDLFNLKNASRKKIQLPERIALINCVVQSQNGNFIISYLEVNNWKDCFISILSKDGMNFIKNVDTRSFGSSPNKLTLYSFVVKEDGQIFATDCWGARVLLFNSDFTGCRDLSTNGQVVAEYSSMVYIQEKQQLFVHAFEEISHNKFISFYSVFHLSRCDTVTWRKL